jgi:LemA protein
MNGVWLILVLLAAVGWLIYQFNTLVGLSNHAHAVWAQIDTQLARRYELAAKLSESVKAAVPGRIPALEQLAQALAAAANAYTPSEKSRTEPAVAAGIAAALTAAQGNSQLANDEQFRQLQHTFKDISDYLEGARREYNALVAELNARAGAFPNKLLASFFGVQLREPFQPTGP